MVSAPGGHPAPTSFPVDFDLKVNAMTVPRRHFLQAAASLAVLPCLWPAHSVLQADENQAASGTQMKLGLVTYEWGKNWDVPTLIKNCTAANFSGVELRTTHKHGVEIKLDAAQREQVRKQFADSAVAVVGLGSTCEYHAVDQAVVRKNIEETKDFVRLSHDIGGTGVKVRPNGLPAQVPVEQTVTQIGAALHEVAEFAKDFGQEIRVEVHGAGTSEVPVLHQIMQAANHKNAVVCWNCNKSDMNGAGLAANFKLLQDKIRTVHIHDLTKNNYPWEELFTLLKGISFNGWTLMEESHVPDDIVAAMKENRAVWEKLTAG